jgi:cobalt-zinc-cadmium efflux system membrane fusion protein
MKNLIIILITSFFVFSCGNDNTTDNEAIQSKETIVTLTDAQYKNAQIVIGVPESRFISSTVKVTGKVDVPPQNLVSISAPLGGYLKSTKLMPGMQIRKGEVLAVLEDQQFIQLQQDYLTAKAKFSLNETEFKRQKELNENKAVSDKVFEQTKANYQTEYVLMKSLEEKLKLIGLNPQKITADNITRSVNILSPIDGFVSTVNVNIGKYINPSDVLFELVNPNDVLLELTVYEKDVEKLVVGQKLTAVTNANPDKKYTLSISLISRSLSNNSVQVVCKFEEPTKDLLPGMFMTAQIDLKGSVVSALPEESVVRFGNKHYVFVQLGDKRYEMTEVTIGSTEDGYIAIENPERLKKIVLKGAYTLLMALKNVSED